MGNQQPKHSEEGLHQHERLGFVRIVDIEDKVNDEIISRMHMDRLVESQSVVQQWRSQMMRIDDSESRQILLLPLHYHFENMGMCGSNGSLHIEYENLSYVLKGEIQNRLKINRYFEEREIWYLLYNMIRAGNKFQRVKRKVGNMHPNSILINDDGQIKIIATCSIPGELDNFQTLVQNPQSHAFLGNFLTYSAPQELANDSVQNAKYPISVNPCLAEVFCIGLTILSAGTLLECDCVYDKRKQSFKLNQNELQNLLRMFKDKYSSYLSEMVFQMLAINPNSRKSSSEIYELLYKYENQILDLEPFHPEISTVPHPQIRPNFWPGGQIQSSPPQMVASNAYGSTIYNRSPYENHQVHIPVQIVNDSRLQRSGVPVQHLVANQVPSQIQPQMGESLSYPKQFRPVMNQPLVQQSVIIAPTQSYIVPEGSSSVMTSSFHPRLQVPLSTMGPNVNTAQSNYLPNYQSRQ